MHYYIPPPGHVRDGRSVSDGLHLKDKLNLVTQGPLDYPPDLLANLDDTMRETMVWTGYDFERMSHMN